MTVLEDRINEYANSMFRHQALPEAWLEQCTRYVQALFGEDIKGKTVIDYAFGRGNWSLAFLRAGAAKVISIDASQDNVNRFKAYCKQHQLESIEVVHGNIVNESLYYKADLVWLYGILHHIADPKAFLNNISSLMSPNAQLYVYYYNANSLREFIVQVCRPILAYTSEKDFLDEAPLFIRPARARASDDLVAPYVDFKSLPALQTLLSEAGFSISRQDIDFQEFLHGKPTDTFYPIQLLCHYGQPTVPSLTLLGRPLLFQDEIAVLKTMVDTLFQLPLSPMQKRHVAIGLFNTHFAYSPDAYHAWEAIRELFLYLAYQLMQPQWANHIIPDTVQAYLALTKAAIEDTKRSQFLGSLGYNRLTQYLTEQRIRL